MTGASDRSWRHGLALVSTFAVLAGACAVEVVPAEGTSTTSAADPSGSATPSTTATVTTGDRTSSGASASSGESFEPGLTSATSKGASVSQGPTSSEGETSSAPPVPQRTRVVIPEQTVLCSRMPDIHRNFRAAFLSKHKLHLDPGVFEGTEPLLAGRLEIRGQRWPIQSDPISLQYQGLGTRVAHAKVKAAPATINHNLEVALHLFVAAEPDVSPPTFIIDDFAHMRPHYGRKRLALVSQQALDLLGGQHSAQYGACAMPSIKRDHYRFELGEGDVVEFEAQTRRLEDDKQWQRGLTVRAKGRLHGASFDVSRWEDLVYGVQELVPRTLAPSLAVRFPEQHQICGVAISPEPGDEAMPYRVHVLDCQLQIKATLIPRSGIFPPVAPR